jgi:sugar lactone lactonase YvrE
LNGHDQPDRCITLIADAKATLGEGPRWHCGRNSLFFVDIEAPCIFACRGAMHSGLNPAALIEIGARPMAYTAYLHRSGRTATSTDSNLARVRWRHGRGPGDVPEHAGIRIWAKNS